MESNYEHSRLIMVIQESLADVNKHQNNYIYSKKQTKKIVQINKNNLDFFYSKKCHIFIAEYM